MNLDMKDIDKQTTAFNATERDKKVKLSRIGNLSLFPKSMDKE